MLKTPPIILFFYHGHAMALFFNFTILHQWNAKTGTNRQLEKNQAHFWGIKE